jgi:hypothetical protein
MSGNVPSQPVGPSLFWDQNSPGYKDCYEYERLSALERDMTRIRYTTFTALLAVSFVLPGLANSTGGGVVNLGGLSITLSKAVLVFGFLFYCFAVMHYLWYHEITEKFRERLKELEQTPLSIGVYSLWQRPEWPILKRFHWALYALGFLYFVITFVYFVTPAS